MYIKYRKHMKESIKNVTPRICESYPEQDTNMKLKNKWQTPRKTVIHELSE